MSLEVLFAIQVDPTGFWIKWIDRIAPDLSVYFPLPSTPFLDKCIQFLYYTRLVWCLEGERLFHVLST
jgi:hypothetical protein